ncbi:MAG TPA: SPOR domain-containing protein, partial [bacterium]|nr:SPOR domain-containing protein [bacterium]
MMRTRVGNMLVVLLLFVAVCSVDARTVTIYRIQLGAYPTKVEAEAKKASAEAEGFSPVYVIEKDGEFPWKVMTGDFAEYAQAKLKCNQNQSAGLNKGEGLVTQVEMKSSEAESAGLPIAEGILDQVKKQLAETHDGLRAYKRNVAQERIQVGVFDEFENAVGFRCQLMAKGAAPVYVLERDGRYAVVVGDFASGEAEAERERLVSKKVI